MAKASKKKKQSPNANSPINGTFDDVISASVSNVGHPTKQPDNSKKKGKK